MAEKSENRSAERVKKKPVKWINNIARVETTRGVVWKIRYYAPVIPGTSWPRKQRPETLIGCKSRAEAEGVLASRKSAVFNRTYRPETIAPITVSEAIEAYAKTHALSLLDSKATVAALRNHVARFLGKLYLPEVTTGICEQYRRDRFAEKKPAKPATVRKELRYLQGVFKQARIDGHDVGDPIADMSFKGINNARTRMPTRDELQRLVDAVHADTTFLRPLFYVLVTTGLRIGSALALRWDRLSEDAFRVEQKGGSTLHAPMMDRLWLELARWRAMIDDKHGWVFPSPRGMRGHLSKSAVQVAWPRLLAAAEVTGLTRHDMRRWVVTALKALAGGDNKAIGQISGHASAAMIDRYDQGSLDRAKLLMPALRDLIPISQADTGVDLSESRVGDSETVISGNVSRVGEK